MADMEASLSLGKSRKRKKNNLKVGETAKRIFNPLPYSKAKELLKEKHSCLCEVELQKRISLPPRFIGNIKAGIHQTLQSWLLTYDEQNKGYLVAYDRVKLKQSTGSINDENPLINFDVSATFIVFNPSIGDKLKGTVTRVGNHHYACLVHDCFNASVRKTNLKKRWHDSQKSIRNEDFDVGSTLYFQVTAVELEDSTASIKGILNHFNSNRNGIRT